MPRKWPVPHKQCDDTSITTSSGKFTFYPAKSLTVIEAKNFCKKEGGILAPITNRNDFEALHKFAIGCTNIGLGRSYFVGLDMIRPETRYFTNGVVFDEEVHGSLFYVYNKNGKLPASWVTYFSTHIRSIQGMETMYSKQFIEVKSRVICLNPAASTSTCN